MPTAKNPAFLADLPLFAARRFAQAPEMNRGRTLIHNAEVGGPAPFLRVGPTRFAAQATAEGPWTPGFCHGGAPAALIAHVVEALPAPVPMQIARMTVNLLRPVPVSVLTVTSQVIREGKNIQIIDLAVQDDQAQLVTRAEVLRVRTGESAEVANLPPCSLPFADAGKPTRPPTGVGFSAVLGCI